MRTAPKVFQVLLKTHKLTIVLSVESGATISAVKEAALGALTSSVLIEHEAREAELRAVSPSTISGAEATKPKGKGKATAIMDEDIDLDDADAELSLGADALPADMRVPDDAGDEQRIPPISKLEDFELAKGFRDTHKNKPIPGVLPTHFEVLKEGATVKTVLNNWETIYLQFREQSSGILMPVSVTPFPVPADDEDDPRNARDRPPTPDLVPSSSSKHKRRRSD